MLLPKRFGALALAVTASLLTSFRTAQSAPQAAPTPALSESALREYTGVYQWGPNTFVYLQLWDEFTGFGKPRLLVAFDESDLIRALYPVDRDHFTAGVGTATPTPVQSQIEFRRESSGKISSLIWQREGEAPRTATRVNIEKSEEVHFSNGDVHLAGTLTCPLGTGKHSAIILVHGSGAEDRDYMLPYAHFLLRHGIAILGYDKRGVGESTGDWNKATFDDLAGDVVAAFSYLRTRSDINAKQIGLLGISQAGWIMPIAAIRAKDIAFLISISGAGISPAETTLDETRNELTTRGVPQQGINNIVQLMQLEYDYARTGNGWDQYSAARSRMATARGGTPPDNFPGTPDAPYFQFLRLFYFYDPAPSLRQLQTPTLALFGELDNNIMAEKNKAAWEAALRAGGNRDYTLKIMPKADHNQWEAKVGSNEEMTSLNGFVHEYFPTIQQWLANHLKSFR